MRVPPSRRTTVAGRSSAGRASRPILQVIDVPHVLEAAERAGTVIDFKVGSGEMLVENGAVLPWSADEADARVRSGTF